MHYVEGCTAPTQSSSSLHSAVVELIAKPGARIRYTTVQKLVDERVQPRGRSGPSRSARRHRRVGRLLPRLEADDEVPVGLPHGRAGPRRDPLDRVRRRGAAPGRRRQDRPRRAEHDVERLREVDLQGRRALVVIAAARGRQGRVGIEVEGRLRRPAARPASRARTPIRRSGSARTTSTSATRPRSRRSATSSSSTSCPTG